MMRLLFVFVFFLGMISCGVKRYNVDEIQLSFKQREVLSLSGCENCIVKAYTVFEDNPDSTVLLTKEQMSFTKPISTDSSEYIYITPLNFWAPIEPITIKYFENGKKLIKEEVYEYY